MRVFNLPELHFQEVFREVSREMSFLSIHPTAVNVQTKSIFVSFNGQSIPVPSPFREKFDMMQDPTFLISGILAPTLFPKTKDASQDYHLFTKLSIPVFPSKNHLTSLYKNLTIYCFEMINDRFLDQFIPFTLSCNKRTWSDNKVNNLSAQYNFLKPTPTSTKLPMIEINLKMK